MDVMYQVMDQMLKSADPAKLSTAKSGGTQAQNDSENDFDTMVRQKRQEAKDPAGQTAGKSGNKPEAEAPARQEPVTAEQYAAAAALMFQPQPNIAFVTPEETAVETPVVLVEPELPTAEAQLPQLGENSAVVEEAVLPEAQLPEAEFTVPEATVETQSPITPTESAGTRNEEDVPQLENLPVETPVFGEVQATPVRVAAPVSRPVALEAEDGIQQLGERLEDVLMYQADENHVQLVLSPADLGRITVELAHNPDGTLHVVLNAVSDKAAALLERGANTLQTILTTPQRPAVQIEVRGSAEASQQFLNPDGQNHQQQQSQQQNQQHRQPHQDTPAREFVQQLRLGLIDLSGS